MVTPPRSSDAERVRAESAHVAADASTDIGLIGGSLEARLAHSKVPPIEHPRVLAPWRREADAEALTEWVLGGPRVHLEIGFARAHHLLALAANEPEARVLGFEVRRLWVRQAAGRAGKRGLDNVRVVEGDCRPFLDRLVPASSLDAMHVLFPDPWWKRKHHKRRLFGHDMVARYLRLLRPGGSLVLRTDVPAYADYALASVASFRAEDRAHLRLVATNTDDPMLGRLPASHRETKCVELGIPVTRVRFVKETAP